LKKFILLHYGFKPPASDIMAAWGNWFDSVEDSIIDMGGHFENGQEITQNGIKTLPRNSEFSYRLYNYINKKSG